jgi:hypothetical protein
VATARRASTTSGQFWADVAGPFLVTGAGTAFTFIPVSIGALAGVAERDARVASRLLNTSRQLGGAIGVAVASTVATRLGAPRPAPRPGGQRGNGRSFLRRRILGRCRTRRGPDLQ